MTGADDERSGCTGAGHQTTSFPAITPADVLALGRQIRYAAAVRGSEIRTEVREGLAAGSASQSDFYEELLVNPTILAITSRRGDLDCGGLRFVVVSYGMFNQVVVPTPSGHVSVAVESAADPFAVAEQLLGLLSTSDGDVAEATKANH